MKTAMWVVAIAFAVSAAGCQKIKTKLGMGDTITNPDAGSPEKVVQDVLKAAKMADEEQGWEKFVGLLHSEETEMPASLSAWRDMKFRAIRKKVDYLLSDKASFSYKVMDRRDAEDGKTVQIFVENTGSDMPTPCRLKMDKVQNNAWKVSGACF